MDIDDELEMLQRELMSAQEQKTNPLSERTVAEIMVKLYHAGFAFYPTTDGNEYLTPDHLDKEIIGLVRQRNKINLPIIPQILNIGIDTLESRVAAITQKGLISKHGTNLYSEKYFQQLIMGLRQRLQSEGKIELQQVAIEHELNIKFVEKLASENLEQLQAELISNQLITKQYTLLKKAKILGFLLSLNNPISIDAFLKITGIENRNIEDIISELIGEGKLKGKYQNSYYVPDRFTNNQKRIIEQFYINNGYIDAEMLQRKFLVSRPEEWIDKNLPTGLVKMGTVYFREQKLESFAVQINEMIKSDGFLELSHVIPMELQEKDLHYFLTEHCKLKDYFICDGYCYSNEWLAKLAAQFKEQIVYNIFFKKVDPKQDKAKKKNSKKQKTDVLTENKLQETLFNCGFAEYSVAQNLAPQLLPLMQQRLEELRKSIEKELNQSKGFINSTFLKYRSCNTILRTEQSLKRMLNIIQKQQGKGERWLDSQFGPTDSDKSGQFSLVYYDNALPKGWPSLQSLKWVQLKPNQLIKGIQPQFPGQPLKKSHFGSLLEMISFHNSRGVAQLHHPQLSPLTSDSEGPFVFQFFISENERRYVLVDSMLPFIEEKPFFSSLRYAYAEKAYAKLRYCYKGILSVGIQQLIFQMTGQTATRWVMEGEKDKEKQISLINEQLQSGSAVLVVGEGESEKCIIFEDKQTQFYQMRLYYLYLEAGKLKTYPQVQFDLSTKTVVQLFKNLIIISQKQPKH